MNPALSMFRRIAYLVWRWRIRVDLARLDSCRLFDLDLVISPGVLHPRHFLSSRLLAEHLLTVDLNGLRVADVGTGSGLLGLLAARAGAQVTALDINPIAVDCAVGNANRNRLSDRMVVAKADVFGGVGEGAFDLIVTNPPFYPRRPETPADWAFGSGEGHSFFRRLATALPSRLTAGGRLLLIHSSDTDFAPVLGILEAAGFEDRIVRERRGLFETLTIREFSSPAARNQERRGALP